MRLVVATLGSTGDLHPFLAVARAAAERGNEVLFLSAEPHRAEVEAQGLRFAPILSAHDHLRCAAHPLLWHPIQGFGVLWRHCAMPSVEPTLASLGQFCAAGGEAPRVLASPLVLGARLAADILPLRLTTGHTAPSALRSLTHPMFIGPWLIPRWLPSRLRRVLWSALDRLKLDPLAAPGINAWRARHGLPPLAEAVFDRWIHSPQRVLGFFPPSFAKAQPDWPVHHPVELVGFPLYLGARQATPDAELDALLADTGAPLVVCYTGSTTTPAADPILAQAKRLAGQGLRVIALGTAAKAVNLGPKGLARQSVHLPQVLPQARLAIHHGGIGFSAHCLAAGIAQVIEASAYDQPDNAFRIAGMQSLSHRGALDARVAEALSHPPRPARPPVPPETYSMPGQPNQAVERILQSLADAPR